MDIAAIVAADDAEIADGLAGILQQMDAGILIKLSRSGLAAIVFVIADAGIDGCLQSSELLVHLLFKHRSHAAIDDVAGNEYQVWLFSVNHVHPTMQLAATVMIADMQIAHRHNLHWLANLLLCGQLQFLAILVLIMQVAI